MHGRARARRGAGDRVRVIVCWRDVGCVVVQAAAVADANRQARDAQLLQSVYMRMMVLRLPAPRISLHKAAKRAKVVAVNLLPLCQPGQASETLKSLKSNKHKPQDRQWAARVARRTEVRQ